MLLLLSLEKFNMPITKEQIEAFQALEAQKAEITDELKRIDGFTKRSKDNRDNARAMKTEKNVEKIFVKFAGTGCYLPKGLFDAELAKRKKELEDLLVDVDTQLIQV